MDYVRLRQDGDEGVPAVARLHDLRDSGSGQPSLDARRGEASRPLVRQAPEAGINFLDTANVYSDGASEEIVGRAIKDFVRRDEDRAGHKGSWPHVAGAERGGPVPQGHISGNRQQPAPPGNRLCRSLSDPSLGLSNSDRGDAGGVERTSCGPARRATSGRKFHVRLAVRQGAGRVTRPRLGRVRVDAEPSEPSVSRGRA